MVKKTGYYYLTGSSAHGYDMDYAGQVMFYRQSNRRKMLSPVYYWAEKTGTRFRVHAFVKNIPGICWERTIWEIIISMYQWNDTSISFKPPRKITSEKMRILASALNKAYPKRLMTRPIPSDTIRPDVTVHHCEYFKAMLEGGETPSECHLCQDTARSCCCATGVAAPQTRGYTASERKKSSDIDHNSPTAVTTPND